MKRPSRFLFLPAGAPQYMQLCTPAPQTYWVPHSFLLGLGKDSVLASVATNTAGKWPEISATISSGEAMSRAVAPLLSTLLFHILSYCDIELIVYILIWNMLFSCTLSVTCRNVQCQHFGCSLCRKSFSRTTGVLQSPHMISWDPDLLFLQYMIYTPPPYSTSFSSWGHFNSTLFDPSKQLREKYVFQVRCPLDY